MTVFVPELIASCHSARAAITASTNAGMAALEERDAELKADVTQREEVT
jgi:hypothetical protein